jgi:hypothetical protein
LYSLQHDIRDVRTQVASNSAALARASNWDFASNAAVYTYMSLEGYAIKQRMIANGMAPKGAYKDSVPMNAATRDISLMFPPGDFHLQSNHAPLYPCRYADDAVVGGSALRLVRTTTVTKQEDASGLFDFRKTDFKHNF